MIKFYFSFIFPFFTLTPEPIMSIMQKKVGPLWV